MGWLVGLSPWLQLPVLLLITLPLAAVGAWVGLWVVDRVGSRRAGAHDAESATVVDHG